MDNICIHAYVSGRVQGVWFRDTTQKKATELMLTGWVRNLPDGRVEVTACGTKESIDLFLIWLWKGSPLSNVTDVQHEEINNCHFDNFVIN